MRGEVKFDERQLKIRGDIFNRAFVLTILLLLLDAILTGRGIIWAEGIYRSILIALIAITVCSVEQVARDVYLADRRQYVILVFYAMLPLMTLIIGCVNLSRGEPFIGSLIQDGALTGDGAAVVMDILFTSVIIAFAVRKVWERRQERVN